MTVVPSIFGDASDLFSIIVSNLPISAAMAYGLQPQQLLQRQPRAKQQRRMRSARQRRMVTVQQHHKGECGTRCLRLVQGCEAVALSETT
jgi:hypothetical protein